LPRNVGHICETRKGAQQKGLDYLETEAQVSWSGPHKWFCAIGLLHDGFDIDRFIASRHQWEGSCKTLSVALECAKDWSSCFGYGADTADCSASLRDEL